MTTSNNNNHSRQEQESAAVRKPPSSPGGCFGAYLEFKDNVPVPRYNPPPDGLITKQIAHSKFLEALSKPFNGWIYDPVTQEEIQIEGMQHMKGRPVLEVLTAVLASKAILGDQKACDALLDRAYGKPAQENTNINIDATETYEQFLEKVAAQENMDLYGGDVIDITPQTNNDDDLDELLKDF
jgi:hypothetical protein